MTLARNIYWLRESVRALDRVYFADTCKPLIKWMPITRLKGEFVYGRWYDRTRTIVVNRALSYEWVPDAVVLSVVYHEMLHGQIGHDHCLAFRLAEQRFVHHTICELWCQEHHDKLLAADQPKLRNA